MELVPTSVSALLVVLLAVLPGVPGDKAYRLLRGSDWREDTWQRVLRLLGFSLFGLAIYIVLAPVLHTPLPMYLSPDSLAAAVRTPESLPVLFGALLGHSVASGGAGLAAAFAARRVGSWGSASGHANAWDYFVATRVPRRWVVTRLANGDAYAGMIDVADTSVRIEERDLVLEEPALYDPEREDYVATEYQYLFLPGCLIAAIGVVHDPCLDSRVSTPGQTLFRKDKPYEEENDVH